MSFNSYDAVAEKVLTDLESAMKKDQSINEFYIVPTLEIENKNSSPILKGENTLGLESWIVTHLYLYAHHQIMQKNNYRNQNLSKVIPCLTGVALLNPEMPTVWSKRRELIIAKKMQVDDELRLTQMALSRKPKCNDVLTHRKWIITEILKNVQDKSSLLSEELKLSEMIANRYHSNYHAWSHRMWSLQHLMSDSPLSIVMDKQSSTSFFKDIESELSSVMVDQSFKPSHLLAFIKHEIPHTYLEELDNNLKWISSHVSDHSGLHFRTFLLTSILGLCKNYFCRLDASELNFNKMAPHELQDIRANEAFAIGKTNLSEFLISQDFGDEYKKSVVNGYLTKLTGDLNCLDLAMFLIATELKSNFSLCLMYPSHEALWYYRRFLVHGYKSVTRCMDACMARSVPTIVVHQDQNGVPCKKDFKFDDGMTGLKRSDLHEALTIRLLNNEEDLLRRINLTNSPDECIRTLLRNYANWLRHCFKYEDEWIMMNPDK